MKDQLQITMKKPVEKNYHLPRGTCPPMLEGRGCYGDCMDCYCMDVDNYKRMQKHLKEQEANMDSWDWQIYSHFGTVKANSMIEAMKKAIDSYYHSGDGGRTNSKIDLHVKKREV